MELSPSDKGRIEHQFDSFCKLVLVCEMKDYKKMILRKMAKEILFSELILIYGYDLEHKKVGQEEIKDIFSIKVMGFDITIKNMMSYKFFYEESSKDQMTNYYIPFDK